MLQDIVNEQMTLRRIADVCIDLYAMTAVIGRAGRSMSIGLRSADHEVGQQATLTMTRAKVSSTSHTHTRKGYLKLYSTEH